MKSKPVSRRDFLQKVGLGATGLGASTLLASCTSRSSNQQDPEIPSRSDAFILDDFARPDAHVIGDGWESMNPGYWHIKDGRLRRRITAETDVRPVDWFPWHWETHRDSPIPVDYDASLPYGMLWRRDWQLSGNYSFQIEFTIQELAEYTGSSEAQFQPGYAVMGICFGSSCLHESWTGSQEGEEVSFLKSLIPGRQPGEAAWMVLMTDDGRFGIYSHLTDELVPVEESAETGIGPLEPGMTGSITLFISGEDDRYAEITALLTLEDTWHSIKLARVNRISFTNGYVGMACRGRMDFQISSASLDPGNNIKLETPLNELQVCYPLADTLQRRTDGTWACKFIALCRNDGTEVSIRISEHEMPPAGWEAVPTHGSAPLINNSFRRNTAVVEVSLPFDPADHTTYYTVWKDGVNVTADPRIGTNSVGPGTGFIGKVPASGLYVGRLPQLRAPYRICGLSCHAIHENNPNLPDSNKYQAWYVHDQPTPDAFEHLEAYQFQVMLWEDDIWYLELMFPPPSADDAYKVITTTIAGPTTRWQMMRHWNILNPGDHDFGMDDVKGPEQLILRAKDNLGQHPAYLRRNFQIVQHLISGDEAPSALTNPKNWRKWRMPDNDFSLYLLDARLWRTSQDTRIWDDEGWGHQDNLYDRSNPTRTLLGEEQFSWLVQQLKADASPLICITGINGLHTIWAGVKTDPVTNQKFDQRDRVTADYAGWVKAGSDRILNLLGSREGITTVYGDVHNGCIVFNEEHRIAECCFGPIGRGSGRAPKEGFAPEMKDYDGRPLRAIALYHADYETPDLKKRTGPFYWNFLEMVFNPSDPAATTHLTIRNVIDAPGDAPRGGAALFLQSFETGRPATSQLPSMQLIPNADVQISYLTGEMIRGTRTSADGTMPITKLVDVMPDTALLVTAHSEEKALSQIIQTIPVSAG